MSDTSSDVEDNGLFNEPEDYYQPEKEPTFVCHGLRDGRELRMRLVGHNPLWVGCILFFSSSFCVLCMCWMRGICLLQEYRKVMERKNTQLFKVFIPPNTPLNHSKKETQEEEITI